jgi:hypothetical protein
MEFRSMPSESKAEGAVIAVLAFGAVFVLLCSRNVDSIETMRRLRMNSVEASIARYTRDVGHLPPSLDALFSSGESGWRGPYASPLDLYGRPGTLTFTALDAGSARYRLELAALPLKSGDPVDAVVHERRVRFVEPR